MFDMMREHINSLSFWRIHWRFGIVLILTHVLVAIGAFSKTEDVYTRLYTIHEVKCNILRVNPVSKLKQILTSRGYIVSVVSPTGLSGIGDYQECEKTFMARDSEEMMIARAKRMNADLNNPFERSICEYPKLYEQHRMIMHTLEVSDISWTRSNTRIFAREFVINEKQNPRVILNYMTILEHVLGIQRFSQGTSRQELQTQLWEKFDYEDFKRTMRITGKKVRLKPTDFNGIYRLLQKLYKKALGSCYQGSVIQPELAKHLILGEKYDFRTRINPITIL